MPSGTRESLAIIGWLEETGRLDAISIGKLRHAIDGCPDDWDARQLLLANLRINAALQVEGRLATSDVDDWICPGFAIEARLGEGAIGTVYRARRTDDGRRVAIKLLHEEVLEDKTTLPRLEREVDVARRLAHAGLPWYGILGTSSAGTPFVEMQLLEGRDLLEVMGSPDRPIDERVAWRVLGQLGRVLAHLDEHGIVHRDVKPGNIMISDSAAGLKDGHVYLCDLGLAWAPGQDAEVTGVGDVVGTPYFMSPEHAYGDRDLRIESDVYALGATVYYAATGRLPFDGPNALDIMRQHAHAPLVPPRKHQPGISRPLDRLLIRTLAKDARERPTPDELARAADKAMAEWGESTSVVPLSTPSRRLAPQLVSQKRKPEARPGGEWVRPFAILVFLVALLLVAALAFT